MQTRTVKLIEQLPGKIEGILKKFPVESRPETEHKITFNLGEMVCEITECNYNTNGKCFLAPYTRPPDMRC